MFLFQKRIHKEEDKKKDKDENLKLEELGTIMTIEIGKKNKNEKFSVFDLNMFHRECEQGTIKLNTSTEGGIAYKIFFECQRCHMQTCIGAGDNVEKTLLAMTQVALNDKIFNTKDTYKGTKIVFLQKR
jgi:hypothetical protein